MGHVLQILNTQTFAKLYAQVTLNAQTIKGLDVYRVVSTGVVPAKKILTVMVLAFLGCHIAHQHMAAMSAEPTLIAQPFTLGML